MSDAAASCFSGSNGDEKTAAQNLVTCTYQAKIGGNGSLITVTWLKNAMGHGLCVAVGEPTKQSTCKVDLNPWCFWRKQGSKRVHVDGSRVDVYWDLGSAKFFSGPEPMEKYYVAVVWDKQVVLLLGDLKDEALSKSRASESPSEAVLVSRKQHVFGKKKFATRALFGESGRSHEVGIECRSKGPGGPALFISVDKELVVEVKRLVWKFRGNDTIYVEGIPIQILWDVHDWLFNPGLGHGMFAFRPLSLSSVNEKAEVEVLEESVCFNDGNSCIPSAFCFLLYAWKCD